MATPSAQFPRPKKTRFIFAVTGKKKKKRLNMAQYVLWASGDEKWTLSEGMYSRTNKIGALFLNSSP